MTLFIFLLVCNFIALIFADLAVDIPSTQLITIEQFKCLYKQGFKTAETEIYTFDGQINDIGVQNMRNAGLGKAEKILPPFSWFICRCLH